MSIVLFELIFGAGVKQFYYGGVQRVLEDKALSSSNFYNMYLKYETLEKKADTILKNYREQDTAELQIIDLNGNIIGSSTGFEHTEGIDASNERKLKIGQINSWQGRVNTTTDELLAVSTPIAKDDIIVGYLRFVTSIEGIKASVFDLQAKALFIGLLILVLSLVLNILLTKTIVRPIKHLTDVSKKIAEGDFDAIALKKYNDEIGELSDTINFMTDEIKKSNNLKNDFISSISHEIRTPLTSIRGWAETIDQNSDSLDKEETNQVIRIILRESKRLTKLVEELLDFSRFESGRIRMNFEKVDLNLLIKDVLKQYRIKAEEKKLNLISNLDDKITYVIGDGDRLRQVFINIVDNACKFTNENGTIIVSTESTPKGSRVMIEDNGIGIPANELPHVTEKFYKGKTNQSGSGLGLSISREIIKLHKGTMNITSTEGQGTRICIEFEKFGNQR